MRKSERGNSVLEMLLYLPSALLLLFVSGDLGLRWVEQGAISAAVQSELREVSILQQRSDQFRGGDSQAALDSLTEILADLDSRLEERILEIKHSSVNTAPVSFSIALEVLRVPIDSESGSTLTNQSTTILRRGNVDSNRVRKLLEQRERLTPGEFAQPQPVLSAAGGYTFAFESEVVLLYVLVSTQTSGLNQSFIKKQFGSFYEAEEELLLALKNF